MIWRDRSTPGPTTTLLASPTTTAESPTTTQLVTTTAERSTTSTTTEEKRLAEVEQILTDLWFGWFDAIYRKEADALWDVVATTSKFEAGLQAMDTLAFTEPPSRAGIHVEIDELLLDRADCLVPYGTTSSEFLSGKPSVTGLEVLWPDPRRDWRMATSWVFPQELWLADCDEVTREETP
jgi:hypothetical protein